MSQYLPIWGIGLAADYFFASLKNTLYLQAIFVDSFPPWREIFAGQTT